MHQFKITPAASSIQRIRHSRIGDLIDETTLMLRSGQNSSLLLVCGPTGAGKSTIGQYLVEAEFKTQHSIMEEDPEFIPAIFVEALASGEKEFSWRLFYEQILEALEGELDAPRTAYGVDPTTGRVVRTLGPQTHRLSGLRTAVKRALKRRRIRFIVVDEAAHIVRHCSARRMERQLDTLKSLSNQCGVQWIMLGSYDLFELLSLSGQLARRTHVMHFARYREDVEKDVAAFRACLKKFGEWLPSLKNVDILAYSDVLHRNTLGCIGTLHDVLIRLECLVEARGWSEDVLSSALLTEAQVTQIMTEIVDGEARIAPGLVRSTCVIPANQERVA